MCGMGQRVESILQEVIEGTRAHNPDEPFRKWLWAAPASGGATFLRGLEAELRAAGRSVIRLELPAYAFDAPEHVLGQICQHLGRSSARDLDPTRPLHTRVREIARPLGREANAPIILLRIPMSWLGRLGPQHMVSDDSRSVLRALLGSDLDAVVVSTQRPLWLGTLLGTGHPLPPLEAGEGFLLDVARWESLLGHARRLHERLGPTAGRRLPIDLRLGVACLAVGLDEPSVTAAFEAAAPTEALVSTLAATLQNRPAWSSALRRLSLPRFPVPADVAEALAGADSCVREVALLCLASRDARGLSLHEALHSLAGPREGNPEPAANQQLAEHYRARDGAPTAGEAIQHAIPWLEHIHHLGRSGREGWSKLQSRPVLSRMSRYELAWSLSVDFHEYELAAEIYRGIALADDKDAYSHHYWAWNLDQAGKDGPTALRAYRRAVALESDNPWYHSRLITFLLDNGFQADARAAFREAMRSLAEAGATARTDLPLQFHAWIARAALNAGDLSLARQVLASLGPEQMENLAPLRALRHELEVLMEIDRLGEALYPANVPVSERWKQKVILPDAIFVDDPTSQGRLRAARLEHFHPGRVLSIDEDGTVELLLADPTRKPPTLFTRELDRSMLARMAGGEAPETGRFLEFGTYEGGQHRVAYHPASRYSFDRDEFLRSLRYLRDLSHEDEP